jgi:hypothetical protein
LPRLCHRRCVLLKEEYRALRASTTTDSRIGDKDLRDKHADVTCFGSVSLLERHDQVDPLRLHSKPLGKRVVASLTALTHVLACDGITQRRFAQPSRSGPFFSDQCPRRPVEGQVPGTDAMRDRVAARRSFLFRPLRHCGEISLLRAKSACVISLCAHSSSHARAIDSVSCSRRGGSSR